MGVVWSRICSDFHTSDARELNGLGNLPNVGRRRGGIRDRPAVPRLTCLVDYRQEGGIRGFEYLAAVAKILAEVAEGPHCLCAFEKGFGCDWSGVVGGSDSV